MKRRTLLILCLIVFCIALVQPAEANLLSNAGFEIGSGSNVEAWVSWDDARIEPWAVYTGSNGIAFYGWTDGGGLYQNVEADGTSNYAFTVYGYKDSDFDLGLLNVDLKLEFYADTTTTQQLLVVTNAISSAPASWSTYSIAATSPPNTRAVRVVMGFGGDVSAGGFKWDDASLTSAPITSSTYYVSLSGSHASPFNSWATAATNIQTAINAADVGDTVMVTDGVYNVGGAVVYGAMTNRIAITNAIFVRSVNGPEHTFIVGNGPRGYDAVRCAYVGISAMLSGFTLTNGHTFEYIYGDYYKERSGGGVWCQLYGQVSNCVITGCEAEEYGAGVYHGILYDCRIEGNREARTGGGLSGCTAYRCEILRNEGGYGGGTAYSTLHHCLVSENDGGTGGGVYEGLARNCIITRNEAGSGAAIYHGVAESCTIVGNYASYSGAGGYHTRAENCIVYYNRDINGPDNAYQSTFTNCFLPEDPGGTAVFTNAPQITSLYRPRLLPTSPCINAGTNQAWMTNAVDCDGNARLNGSVDVGADEYHAGTMTGTLSVVATPDFRRVVAGYTVRFEADVRTYATTFDWLINGETISNLCVVDYTFAQTGTYDVVLSARNNDTSAAVTTTVYILDYTCYVDDGSATPSAPFASWATAATNIQDAISASYRGGRVIVSNGTYASGGTVVDGGLTNRVAVTNEITLQSVNGPNVTTIQGQGPMGPAAVRGAYVDFDCALLGFTLTGGATSTNIGDYTLNAGGGALCESRGLLSNCVVNGNSATHGGGTQGGIILNSTLSHNLATYYGGATHGGTIRNSILQSNTAHSSGGASEQSTLYNCLILDNTATNSGGGTHYGSLYNCTVSGNHAYEGGGAYGGKIRNSILYYNTCDYNGLNYIWFYFYSPDIEHCCFEPTTISVGNISNRPGFKNRAAGDYTLTNGSVCIDAGMNISNDFDLYGVPRPLDGDGNGTAHWDMGAYEFASPVFDTDDDTMPDYDELVAGTDPLSGSSFFAMTPGSVSDWTGGAVVVEWSSVAGKEYSLMRSTNLMEDFSVLSSNIVATPTLNSYTDSTATASGPYYYKIMVE